MKSKKNNGDNQMFIENGIIIQPLKKIAIRKPWESSTALEVMLFHDSNRPLSNKEHARADLLLKNRTVFNDSWF